MNFLAKLVSAILHPLLMPLASLFLLLHFDPYLSHRFEIFFYLTLIISINSLAPAVSLWFMHKRKVISDLDITDRKERAMPFFIVLSYFTLAYILSLEITGIFIPVLYRSLLLGLVLSIFVGWLITFKFKLSMHMLGSGGVLAAILAVGNIYNTIDIAWISAIIIGGGLMGWSRLYLKAHTRWEVYTGYAVGFLCMGSSIYFELG
ncbi:MAG TPA: hypothetical protein EYN28_08215 [Flavobacteriales bacterium]|jgi:hypothetical protein|nr:hypothetical protein [Flavobacteriales bacterium]HHZ94058.1 hypothetical protein [Flavobacteriales bacterium]HIB78034.1 hypothetical protein [Flavobacteriales bacterium]HIN41243.1 hypothetical protein [Flavobacteriales bacterium]HIO16396.1 hypothetical protein [Flavobacteriales bacterium]